VSCACAYTANLTQSEFEQKLIKILKSDFFLLVTLCCVLILFIFCMALCVVTASQGRILAHVRSQAGVSLVVSYHNNDIMVDSLINLLIMLLLLFAALKGSICVIKYPTYKYFDIYSQSGDCHSTKPPTSCDGHSSSRHFFNGDGTLPFMRTIIDFHFFSLFFFLPGVVWRRKKRNNYYR
jgi:hypothetical protein